MNANSNPESVTSQKVLIADDDAPTRILLRTAISQWGYEVIEAKDGEEAWSLLQKENAPRLVILDWLMPKMDGITVCERCKNQVIDFQPFIIMLTQMSGSENIVKGIEAGVDEFLSKPFNMAELRSRLSTGSKIVRFGNEILKKTMELNLYQKKINKLVREISLITYPLNDAVENNTAKNIDMLELKKSLAKINTIINELLVLDTEGD